MLGPGVTVHYARALIQAAEDAGVSLPSDLVDRVSGTERIPLAWQDELWEVWCSENPDPLAALQFGMRIQVGHLDSAGMLLVTCETLGEALQELEAYAPLIGEGVSFAVRRAGARVHVDLTERFAVRAVERTESAIAALLHLTRWATAERFRPTGVWFGHAPLATVSAYEAVLGVPAYFSAARTSLGLSADQLDLPMTQANESLRDHIRELADRTLASLGEQTIAVRLQQVIRTHPAWNRERVAQHLDLSSRQLNRRLAETGLTFKTVRERTLEELAIRQLRGGATVVDVAANLGYSDETAFARAFRRWRGVTPGRFGAGP